MIGTSVKNFFKSIGFYFIPLGVMSFFTIIYIAWMVPTMIGVVQNSFQAIADKIGSTSFNWDEVLPSLMAKAMEYADPAAALGLITNPNSIIDLLKETAMETFGLETITNEIMEIITGAVSQLTVMLVGVLAVIIISFVIGFVALEVLMRKYSPYMLDKDNNYLLDASGQPQPSDIYEELFRLKNMLDGKCRDSVEKYLKSLSPEKMAAIELHYPNMPFSEGKNLRDAIKECCLVTGFGWSGYNTERCQRIFDIMDESAMICPINMACALKQTLTNHRIWGFGVDDDRVVKLLKMLGNNKAFRKAVEDEYLGLMTDINSKWFLNDEAKALVAQYWQ